MNAGRFLAEMNLCLCALACCGYLLTKDWWNAMYWFGAALITASVVLR